MEIKRCPSPFCGRPFQVNEYKLRQATTLNKGQIICPHCGKLMSGKRNSVFLTHALSFEEEAEVLKPRASEMVAC